MGKTTRRDSGLAAAAAVLVMGLSVSCHQDFESPYLPGSKNYAGDDWTRDSDGDGVADSVEKYAPNCKLAAQQCIETAKLLSKLQGSPSSLTAMDMILWIGDKASPPRLIWAPAEASMLGYVLVSSDSSKVRPTKDGSLSPMGVGSAQITVTVPDDSNLAASFIAKVVSAGKKVDSVSVKDLAVYVDRDTAPDVTWTPADATVQEYYLVSDKPDVAKVVGQTVLGVSPGKAAMTLESADGGHKAAFSVAVTASPAVILTDSILVEDMFLVSGGAAEAPIIHWYPDKAGDKRYNLLSTDTSVVSLNGKKDQVIPKAAGSARVYAYALDGSGKTAAFTVNISSEAVAVTGIAAADLNLIVGADAQSPKLAWSPANATNRKYSLASSQPDVALIQGSMIQPMGMGTSEVVVTTQEGGFRDTFLVTVGRPDTSVHVDSIRVQDLSISLGTDSKPVIAWYPDNAGNRVYGLASADPSIAVPQGELVHPLKAGTTQFTLTSGDGGKTAKFQVTVYVPEIPVASVKADSMSLVIGGNDQSPVLTWSPSNATNLNYALVSQDTTIAAIVNGTKVHAKAVGTTKVTVQPSDGPAAIFNVVVNAIAIPVISLSVKDFTLNLADGPKDPPDLVWNPANATNKGYSLKADVGATLVIAINANKIVPESPGKTILTITPLDANAPAVKCSVTVVALTRSLSAGDDTLRLGAAASDPSSLFTWDPPNADKSFALKSLDTTIVKTAGNATKLLAVAGGAGRVQVKALDGSGKADTFSVLVKIPVKTLVAKDVTLNLSDSLVNPGNLFTWGPANATDRNWYLVFPTATAPNSIVRIVNGWELQAVGQGTAYVTVVSSDSAAVRDTFAVTVVQPVTGLKVDPLTVKVGADSLPTLIWTPTNAADKSYTLISQNTAVATASGGKVHGVAGGTAGFQAVSTANPSCVGNFTVTVTVPVVSVSGADLAMKYGDPDRDPVLTWTPADASNKGYTLTSSNPSVLLISAGKLHAAGPGASNVFVNTADGNKLDTFAVSVTVPVISVSIADMVMRKGEDTIPVITWTPSNASDKNGTIASANPAIATFLDGYRIHGAGGGTTTMTATTEDGGKTATFSVTVTVPVQGLTAGSFSMKTTDPDQDPALTWTPADATNKGYTMTTMDTGVVTIVDGKIHAVGRGNANVTVTSSDGGFTDTFSVQILR